MSAATVKGRGKKKREISKRTDGRTPVSDSQGESDSGELNLKT